MPLRSPTLWVVATPLGNLGDFSPRAQAVLSEVDLVLAEDTRRAGRLFEQAGLKTGRVISFYEHNEQARQKRVLEYLAQGQQVALISDAGSPLIADPGYRLVRACRKAGYAVRPVPGPSAVLAALMASGLPPLPFIFLGFLPRKPGQQRQLWRQYAQLSCTLIFFERKSRLRETLATAASELGGRELCLARELTKVHEQFIFIQLDKWEGIDPDIRGELTVLIGPPQTQIASQNEVEEYLRRALAQGGRPREIVRNVQGQLPGWTSKSLYQVLMGMQDKG